MQVLLILLQVLTCVALVALVLLQQGKGAEIGAAFGSGASSTVFGSPGASSFLFKLTAGIAALFFATSLGLGYYDGIVAKKAQQIAIPTAMIQQQQQQNAAIEGATQSAQTATPAIAVDTPTVNNPIAPTQPANNSKAPA
ncbi:MAG: preprotein translocase subunit SecG [Gammaproteobacteria bacterium]